MPNSALPKTIAYFCAEFGIDSNTPTYAGGLGILAGDTLKEAADRDYPMIGIGLLYRGQYFIQHINNDGWQTEEVSLYDPASACLRQLTINGEPLYIIVNLAGVDVHIKVYQIRVGDHTTLYFLSSDSHHNPDDWRSIMSADYWGDAEVQLRQQLILGVGGAKLIKKLGIKPDIYHFNEGRPCLVAWELISQLMENKKLNFEEAAREAKTRIVYTNHTLLRAGNLRYNLDLVKKYAFSFSSQMGVDVEQLLYPGMLKETNEFGITEYAMNLSSKVNSVSERHQQLSEKEWPEYKWLNVTNGIHLPSWQNTHFRDPNLSPSELWHIHTMRKHELMNMVLRRSGFGYDPNRLVISWARRMAAYKQLDVLFADIKKLKDIVSQADKPVQILVAGKAHPGDQMAKEHIQQTIQHFANELAGYAIFVPNYDIALARAMVQGSDVWLNTPEWGKEACGTSGMKAISNGVLNCTVADGWAAEVDWEGLGWVLDHQNISNCFYDTLEHQIVPLYYNRNEEGLPSEWIDMMKKSIVLSHKYSTERMFDDYLKLLYS